MSFERGGWRWNSPGGVVRVYLCLLPLAALVTYYFLIADRMTATSPSALQHARYGWPFDWVEQDLSRYQPVEFPVTIEYNFLRAWHDPIETHYDWFVFAADALIVGIGVTACFYALVHLVKMLSRRTRQR